MIYNSNQQHHTSSSGSIDSRKGAEAEAKRVEELAELVRAEEAAKKAIEEQQKLQLAKMQKEKEELARIEREKELEKEQWELKKKEM